MTMLSHNRPMAEVLAPTRKDLRQEFEAGFAGMTEEPVTLEALYDAREALIAEVVGKMPAEHRRFLLSFKAGEPEWDLLGVPGAADLPAVRWKVDNLAELSEGRREKLLSDLRRVLATCSPRHWRRCHADSSCAEKAKTEEARMKIDLNSDMTVAPRPLPTARVSVRITSTSPITVKSARLLAKAVSTARRTKL